MKGISASILTISLLTSSLVAASPALAQSRPPSLLKSLAASGSPSPIRGLYVFTLPHGGLDRTYHLFAPSTAGKRPLPLVIVLHGGYGSPEEIAAVTRMHSVAGREGFLVAYPAAAGVDSHWNDGRATVVPNVDDVGFIDAMIEDIATRVPVASDRIFVTGASNGGMMTLRLACEVPQRFRAFAPVVANFHLDLAAKCEPSQPVPILFIHGTADPLMPYAGGNIGGGFWPLRGVALSAPASVAFWAENNGCWPEPETVRLPDRAPTDGTRVARVSYPNCAEASQVVQFRVDGGGHTWPGSNAITPPRSGLTSKDISATEEIWFFFRSAAAAAGPVAAGR